MRRVEGDRRLTNVMLCVARAQAVARPVETSRQFAASAASAALALSATPALAGDLFGPEYAGAVAVGGGIIVVGTGAIVALLLPFITGTLNPVQMVVNLTSANASNLRKFKRNGEPMEHGGKFGHKWYKTDAYCNGKYIDFAGVQKSNEAEQKQKAR